MTNVEVTTPTSRLLININNNDTGTGRCLPNFLTTVYPPLSLPPLSQGKRNKEKKSKRKRSKGKRNNGNRSKGRRSKGGAL